MAKWNGCERIIASSVQDSPASRPRGGCVIAANRSRSSRRAIVSAGRVWNREASDGSVVSVGGTWLGRGQDRMFRSLPRAWHGCLPTVRRERHHHATRGVNRRYQGLPKVGLFGLIGLGLAFWQLDRMVKRVPPAEPWKAPAATRLDAQTLDAWFPSPWNVPSARRESCSTRQ